MLRAYGVEPNHAATINAAPKTVFDIVSDLSLHAELAGSRELNKVTQQPPGPVGLGTRLFAEETMDQYLIPMLTYAGAYVIPIRESDWGTQRVVVDDGSAGYAETGAASLFSNSSLAGWGPPQTGADRGRRPRRGHHGRPAPGPSAATRRSAPGGALGVVPGRPHRRRQ